MLNILELLNTFILYILKNQSCKIIVVSHGSSLASVFLTLLVQRQPVEKSHFGYPQRFSNQWGIGQAGVISRNIQMSEFKVIDSLAQELGRALLTEVGLHWCMGAILGRCSSCHQQSKQCWLNRTEGRVVN